MSWGVRGACRGLLCNGLGAAMVIFVAVWKRRTRPQAELRKCCHVERAGGTP